MKVVVLYLQNGELVPGFYRIKETSGSLGEQESVVSVAFLSASKLL